MRSIFTVKRKRIALTMRLQDAAPAPGERRERNDRNDRGNDRGHIQQRARMERPAPAPANSAMAAAFAKLKG